MAPHRPGKVIFPAQQSSLASLQCPQGPCAPSLPCHLRSPTLLELSASSHGDCVSLIYTSDPTTQSNPWQERGVQKEVETNQAFTLRSEGFLL